MAHNRLTFRTAALAAMAIVAALNPIGAIARAAAFVQDALTGILTMPTPRGGVLGANTLTGLIPTLFEAMAPNIEGWVSHPDDHERWADLRERR